MKVNKNQDSILVLNLLKLLNETKMTLDEISKNSGVTRTWLEKVKYKKIADPSVVKVELVLKFFGMSVVIEKSSMMDVDSE